MREIKYRAKSAHCDAWCYGNLIVYEDEKWESEIVGFDVYKEGRSEWMEEKIEYDTICQFTGLYDQNGKEIYEGDIVRWTRHNVNAEGIHNVTWVDDCTIYWNDEKHAFWKHYDFENGGGASGILDFKDERAEYIEYEVIGNIYDTPQLLKGGKE